MNFPRGCVLCARRKLRGQRPLPSFLSAEGFVRHCFEEHRQRLRLQTVLRCKEPWSSIQETFRTHEGDLTIQRSERYTSLAPGLTRFNGTHQSLASSGALAAAACMVAQDSARYPHLILVDIANVEDVFQLLHDVDPAAEITLRDTGAFFVVIAEPGVRLDRNVGSVPYAVTMLEANRLLIVRSHGGFESGDLLTSDFIARVTTCREFVAFPDPTLRDSFTVHLLTNDRRLARCAKDCSGRETPLIEHHCFERTAVCWWTALVDMLELTYLSRTPSPSTVPLPEVTTTRILGA